MLYKEYRIYKNIMKNIENGKNKYLFINKV